MTQLKNWLLQAIQEHKTDPLSRLLRICLYAVSLVYRVIVRFRNWAYDHHWLNTHRAEARIISVGNLTTGGTGKTPFVIWLANQLQTNSPTAIVSRGYGSHTGKLNDEGLEIAWRTNDLLQVQDRDRVQAAGKAIQLIKDRHAASTNQRPTIILDDGFQHRRLSRDLNIVLIDATNPFGHGHLLPRGLLREETSGLRRADLVVLTRANQVETTTRKSILSKIRAIVSDTPLIETAMGPASWLTPNHQEVPLTWMRNKKVYAFCGIGNPSAFHQTLTSIGVVPEVFKSYDDHFKYGESDFAELISDARQLQCDAIICTMKDMVKLPRQFFDQPFFALLTEIQFLSGQSKLLELVQPGLPKLKDAG